MRLRPLGLVAVFFSVTCASSTHAPAPRSNDKSAVVGAEDPKIELIRHVDKLDPPLALAGARCSPGERACTCRKEGAQEPETQPPAEGKKRFEVRLSATAGEAALNVPGIGVLTGKGLGPTCYYFDLPSGSALDVAFHSRSTSNRDGFSPHLRIAEYGPTGPFWYDSVEIDCAGEGGLCDRTGANRWVERARATRRGRVDPCGSAVTSKLHWETTGSESARDSGFFHDFLVTFRFEVKAFAPQFAPGSTECVPK